MPEKQRKRQSIAIDFDGTIVKYPKFIAPDKIPYEPIDGAKEALETIAKYFRIVIFSVRANVDAGKKGIAEWMEKHQIPYDEITDKKPSSVLYIDDNALTFEGDWSKTLKQIANWKHYNKK